MADLSSYKAFIKSASFQLGEKISSLLAAGLPKRISLDEWELGKDSFEGPEERYSAAAYGIYRRKCRKAGVEPGEFEETRG